MRRIPALLVVIALSAGTALAADQIAPPPRDLVTLLAHTTWPAASPGGANEGTCFVANNTTGPVRVSLDVHISWADGTLDRISGISDPGVLEADGAFELNVFFVVPEGAALGPAWFICEARAIAPGGRPEWEAAAAGFDVVP